MCKLRLFKELQVGKNWTNFQGQVNDQSLKLKQFFSHISLSSKVKTHYHCHGSKCKTMCRTYFEKLKLKKNTFSPSQTRKFQLKHLILRKLCTYYLIIENVRIFFHMMALKSKELKPSVLPISVAQD